MKFGTKAQAAMEYLMTYGWAVLVVMIVGIVMWQLGIFNIGTTTITASGFSRIKPQLAGTGMKSDGRFDAIFMNGAGTTIELRGGVVTTDTGTCAINGPVTVISAGDNFKLTGAGCIAGKKVGDVYQAKVYLTYSLNIGGIGTTHTEYGVIRGPVEA